MILTTAVGLLLCVKLFRWEKEEKMRPAAKLWVLAVLLPFVLLGTWQAHAKDNVSKIEDHRPRSGALHGLSDPQCADFYGRRQGD